MMVVCPRNIKTPAGRQLLWIVPFSHCCSCTPHELLRHDHQHVLQDENPGRSTRTTKNDLHLDRGAAEVEQFDAVLGPAGDATVAAKTPTPRRPPESRRQGKGAATPAAAASSVSVKSATLNATDHAGENYDLPAPASVVLVEELQRTRTGGQHSVLDQSKCSNQNEDCCAHPNWGGEEQTCKEGYLPIPDPAPLTWCSSKREDCATHRDNGIGCYGCYAPFRVKDQSRCSDPGQNCCAHRSWGKPQTCRDGYEPIADPSPSTHCSSTSSDCATRDNGIGCYGCFAPYLGIIDQSKCNNKEFWGTISDCCSHPGLPTPNPFGEFQSCRDGYWPVADPSPNSWCSSGSEPETGTVYGSNGHDCAALHGAHKCYGCYAPVPQTQPEAEGGDNGTSSSSSGSADEGSSSTFGIAAVVVGGVLLLIGSIWLGKELAAKPEAPEDAVVVTT